MADFPSISLDPSEIVDFLRQRLWFKEVYREICCQKILDRVAGERGIEISSEEIKQEVDRVCYENHLVSPSEILAWLTDHMTTLNMWELGIRYQLLAQKLAKNLFADEAQRIFAEHQQNYEQILLYRITVPYAPLSQELFYRIEEEEISFYEAAHLYNMEPMLRMYCGYEGKKYRQDLKPEIAEIAFRAVEGEVIGPFQSTPTTYDLFLVEEFSASNPHETYQRIIDHKFAEWLEQELASYVSR